MPCAKINKGCISCILAELTLGSGTMCRIVPPCGCNTLTLSTDNGTSRSNVMIILNENYV